jgi:hypothetical protein
MKKIYQFFTVMLLVSITITMTSSLPASKESVPENTPVTAKTENPTAPTENTGGKPTLTYKELKTIATQIKGEKLSFKEKIALKLFGKKIANKLSGFAKHGGGGKSQIIAFILCWLVGGLGIHRFYLGYTWQGIVQLLTFGGCGIWVLIDFIRIITGDLKPKDDEYEKTF